MTTALIIDGDPAIRGVVRLGAASVGIDVVGEASDGKQALDVARTTRPDIIVLERLDAVDGQCPASMLRKTHPKAKMICLSGVTESMPEWADDFVSKDEIDHLFDLLRDLAKSPAGNGS